ncbi:MAG TPA: glycoside hydrolase family 99-like domain-containing protein [Bryobacteraceae bacterium]|nr:glycoside hydrolase family 99-like domain-containing protein [Bryobacteraceae bacterium]
MEFSVAETVLSASGRRVVTIYTWNEWTEDGYLEPDTVNGLGYLNPIKTVFGPRLNETFGGKF